MKNYTFKESVFREQYLGGGVRITTSASSIKFDNVELKVFWEDATGDDIFVHGYVDGVEQPEGWAVKHYPDIVEQLRDIVVAEMDLHGIKDYWNPEDDPERVIPIYSKIGGQ